MTTNPDGRRDRNEPAAVRPDEPPDSEVDCCVVGGGPAGVVAALLLARAGVRVLVLEKHGDFLRDFRGDTVHPSTQRLLAEVGLWDGLQRLPQREVTRLALTTDDGTLFAVDLGRLPAPFRSIRMIPQWDLLDFLVASARAYPTFDIRMRAEAVGLLVESGPHGRRRVAGVRYRGADGTEGEVRAALTLAADGRDSTLRDLAGLRLREFGAPMDVVWFRLAKPAATAGQHAPSAGAQPGLLGRISRGAILVMIDRRDYWQAGFLVAKGGFARLRQEGIAAFRARLAALVPSVAGSVGALRDFDDTSVLSVRLDRLRRWHRPGLLFIGDAAHAMSPIGGVGINLAVQDAAAAARLLAAPLRSHRCGPAQLARVRRRRLLPTVLIQAGQRAVQQRVVRRVLAGEQARVPGPLLLLGRVPALARLPARVIGLGILTEHAPPAFLTPSRVDR